MHLLEAVPAICGCEWLPPSRNIILKSIPRLIPVNTLFRPFKHRSYQIIISSSPSPTLHVHRFVQLKLRNPPHLGALPGATDQFPAPRFSIRRDFELHSFWRYFDSDNYGLCGGGARNRAKKPPFRTSSRPLSRFMSLSGNNEISVDGWRCRGSPVVLRGCRYFISPSVSTSRAFLEFLRAVSDWDWDTNCMSIVETKTR